MKKIAVILIFSLLIFGFSMSAFADETQQSSPNVSAQQMKEKILNLVNKMKNMNGEKEGHIVVRTITSSSFHNPEGMAISSNGNIWVANHGNGTVIELNDKYKVIGAYSVGNMMGNIAGSIPQNIAIDMSGDLWVVNGGGFITELSPQGVFLQNYDTGSYSDDITISPGGLIWVTSTLNNSSALVEMTSSGELVSRYLIGSVSAGPHNVVIDANGNVWATKENPSLVVNLNMQNNVFSVHPAGNNPWGIAIAPNGNVFAVDNGVWPSPGHSIVEFNSQGVIFGIYPTGQYPKQIAIDTDGDIWVTNQGSNSVTELSPQGITLGSYHVGKSPWGIVIAHNGNVIVSNKEGNSLSVIKGAENTPEYFPYQGPQWP
ncbi:MAG: Vgb family protein [bacterium]